MASRKLILVFVKNLVKWKIKRVVRQRKIIDCIEVMFEGALVVVTSVKIIDTKAKVENIWSFFELIIFL